VEIIAHRGASHDAPENTLAAVKLAWQQQTDAVEVDVYLSADRQIVVVHDKTLKRYGGPDKPIADTTYAELQKHEVGSWKDDKWRGEPIPLLSEILKTIPQGKRLFIEIKCGVEIMPHLVKVLQAANLPPERTAIICFSEDVIAAAARQLPELKRYWLASLKADKVTGKIGPSLKKLISTAKTIDSDGLDLGGKLEVIDENYVSKLNRESLPLYIWTINSPEDAARFSKLGVKGITTDRPALLREHKEDETSDELR
jgi:glycerophosphoryl diester phosphodiesterase